MKRIDPFTGFGFKKLFIEEGSKEMEIIAAITGLDKEQIEKLK